jgi:hypothetical protein
MSGRASYSQRIAIVGDPLPTSARNDVSRPAYGVMTVKSRSTSSDASSDAARRSW